MEQDEVVDDADLQHSTISYRPGLLNGLTRPLDIQTLISSLPPRTSTDKLINRFFEMYNPAIPVQCEYPET